MHDQTLVSVAAAANYGTLKNWTFTFAEQPSPYFPRQLYMETSPIPPGNYTASFPNDAIHPGAADSLHVTNLRTQQQAGHFYDVHVAAYPQGG